MMNEFELMVENVYKNVENNMLNGKDYSDEEVLNLVEKYAKKEKCDESDRERIVNQVFNIIRREDVLTELLMQDDVTEIMVNGLDNIFIEKDGVLMQTDIRFPNKRRLRNVINHIVAKVGRQIDDSTPIVDARLIDGSRVNAVLDPIVLNGPTLTIRKFPKNPLTMDNLIENKTVTSECAEFLEKLVKAKYNIFISGGTGSGKTTLLNILSNYIGDDERVITIEDSAELQINHIRNILRMEVRNGNTSGNGKILMSDLIKSSLRMRPDRIIVGEVRREEAIDMLQAMNTGHDGSLSTGHANNPKDMMRRLETMVLTNNKIPIEAVRGQIESAIDIVVHVSRTRDKSRKITAICEVQGFDEMGNVNVVPLFEYKDGKLIRTGNKMINTEKMECEGYEGL